MAELVSLFLLAFAVSLDSFGVGITYGLRKVNIPLRSILIIAVCSAGMIFAATGVAQGFLYFLSFRSAEAFGGLILIALGCWALYNMSRTKLEKKPSESRSFEKRAPYVWTLELKKLGIVIQILRTPMAADIDKSGNISGREAFILGFALALDAFGAGVGAALIGYSPWLTAALIGTMSSLFVYVGMRCGDYFAYTKWINRFSYVPGLILIIFGICKVI